MDILTQLIDKFKKLNYQIEDLHFWRPKTEGYITIKKHLEEFVIYLRYEVNDRKIEFESSTTEELKVKQKKYENILKIIKLFLKKNNYHILESNINEIEVNNAKKIGAYIIFGKEGKNYTIDIIDETQI